MLSVVLLLLPLRWVIAWCLAVAVHETGHYIALCACRATVTSVSFSARGIKILTGYLPPRVELICAISGPVAGIFLTFFSKHIPYTAFCAFLQSVFNLMPIHPLDGGRVLRVVLRCLIKNDENVTKVERFLYALSFSSLLLLAVVFHLGAGVIAGILLYFTQNILANRRKKLYNRDKLYL